MTQQPPPGPPHGGRWQPPPAAPGQQPWRNGAPPQWNAPNTQQPHPHAPNPQWRGQPAPQQPLGWTLNDANNLPRGNPQQGNPHQGQQQSPHAPLGQQPLDSVSIDDYQLPKSKSRFWLTGAAVLVIAALAATAIWTSGRPQPVAEGSPTPTPSQRVLPSSVPSGNAVAFTSQADDAEGHWQIEKAQWTDRGLELLIKVTVTKGSFGYNFFCLDNATTDDYDPATISDSNVLRPGTLNAGESAQGLIVFEKDKGDSMIYLANRFGRQVSALAVGG